jgi:hypothetical protein
MKYYANVTFEADDEKAAEDLLTAAGLTILAGPDPESEDEDIEDDEDEGETAE